MPDEVRKSRLLFEHQVLSGYVLLHMYACIYNLLLHVHTYICIHVHCKMAYIYTDIYRSHKPIANHCLQIYHAC